MSDKGGIFGFLKKGFGGGRGSYLEEEKNQRNYAREKAREEDKGEKPVVQAVGNQSGTVEVKVVRDEVVDYLKEKVEKILDLCGFDASVNIKKNDTNGLVFDIVSKNDAGRIIGKDGATLDSLQTLVRGFVFQKFDEPVRAIVDIEDYRKRRKDMLRQQAQKAAREAKDTNKGVKLRPMSSFERREVHMMFEKDDSIQTFSTGDGYNRCVVLEKSKEAVG